MRLSPQDCPTIKNTAQALLGVQVRVRLFGSRLDDERKGGDIDVLVQSDAPLESLAYSASLLSVRLQRQLRGRSVDVVLSAPNLQHSSIHEHALRTGVLL